MNKFSPLIPHLPTDEQYLKIALQSPDFVLINNSY